MINELIKQDMEDTQDDPSWLKWVAIAAIAGIMLFALVITANAACTSCAQVKKHVQAIIPGTPVGDVHKSDMKGVFEVMMGKTIAYTNHTGKLLIIGHMYDPAHNRDITAERLADINRIAWKDLPLKDAIVHGPRHGLKLAIFTDPECPYCRHLEEMLQHMKGIRTYTFLFPLESIHPQARSMAESIWCSRNRHKAMLDVMINGKTLKHRTCSTPIDRNIQLGRKIGINGTPGLVSGSGRILAGAPQSPEALRAWLVRK